MLREVQTVRQVPGRPRRRWFEDDRFDLIVWSAEDGTIVGIQLCYDKGTACERALTWLRDGALSHSRVDDGENRPFSYKMSPILVPDAAGAGGELLTGFRAASRDLEPAIAQAVVGVIERFIAAAHRPEPAPSHGPRG